MTVSIIIPAGPKDLEDAKALASTIKGAGEIILGTEGRSPAEARNLAARRARFDELLFLDADMALPEGLNVSRLSTYGYDLATAFYRTLPIDGMMEYLQNLGAAIGSPTSYIGGFMYVKRFIFDQLGGFRELYAEDTEFATRAWWSGYQVSTFPFEVHHERPFKWSHIVGPTVTEEGRLWGVP